MGTFAVPMEWTDQHSNFSPDNHHQKEGLILDFQSLLALSDLLKNLDSSKKTILEELCEINRELLKRREKL